MRTPGAALGPPSRTRSDRRPRVRAGDARRRRCIRILGKHPLGWLFSAPYLIFVFAIFAYPLIFAGYMSFHDYFFAAPGARVDRPFVGFENYTDALTDPAVRQSFVNVGIFLIINVPLTVVLSLVLATLLNQVTRLTTFLRASFFVPYVTASVAVVGVWLFLFSGSGLVNQLLGPLGARPDLADQPDLGDAVDRVLRDLEAAGLLHPALPGGAAERAAGAVRVGGHRRRRPVATFWNVTVPGVRPATVLVLLLATVTGANLFTEPYLLTGGGGPNGASTSPVLIMYQQGIQQGKPGYAAAIGIVLVIWY